jgi:hypothetical protein
VSSQASFVFEGSVVAVGAATVEMVDVDDLTAVVRVDRVLRAPEQMEHVAGREITVQLRAAAEAGTSAVFEADGWLYGASMAVVEVGRRREAEGEPSAAAADEDIQESAAAADRAEAFRDALEERAAEAAAVVVGRVTGVRETAAPTEGRLSEHDPQWAVATVEVDEAVKGRPPRTVEVMFATSEDVMWQQAPKLNVGQKAVMLLQKGAPEVEEKRAHAVIDRLDVQPADTAELVAELVERKPTRRRRR